MCRAHGQDQQFFFLFVVFFLSVCDTYLSTRVRSHSKKLQCLGGDIRRTNITGYRRGKKRLALPPQRASKQLRGLRRGCKPSITQDAMATQTCKHHNSLNSVASGITSCQNSKRTVSVQQRARPPVAASLKPLAMQQCKQHRLFT